MCIPCYDNLACQNNTMRKVWVSLVYKTSIMTAPNSFSLLDAKAYNNSYFGEEVGQFKLHQVNCVGDESVLLDCQYTIDSYDCYYYEAAGVECIGMLITCCVTV